MSISAEQEQRAVDTAAFEAQRAKIRGRLTLEGQAAAAITANKVFLDITAPPQARVLAQVQALTRQNNTIIRLLLDDLTGTD